MSTQRNQDPAEEARRDEAVDQQGAMQIPATPPTRGNTQEPQASPVTPMSPEITIFPQSPEVTVFPQSPDPPRQEKNKVTVRFAQEGEKIVDKPKPVKEKPKPVKEKAKPRKEKQKSLLKRTAEAMFEGMSPEKTRHSKALRSKGPMDVSTWAPRRPLEYKPRKPE